MPKFIVNRDTGWPTGGKRPAPCGTEIELSAETAREGVDAGYLVPVSGSGAAPTTSRAERHQVSTSGGASIPVMITKAMEADLARLGYSEAEINAMTPDEAHAKLTAPK